MNENPNEAQCATQTQKILAHLKEGKTLTTLEALELFGCFRLASRISELRREHGFADEIQSRKIVLPNGKRVAQYYYQNPQK